jgi:hypothetical protein
MQPTGSEPLEEPRYIIRTLIGNGRRYFRVYDTKLDKPIGMYETYLLNAQLTAARLNRLKK